MDPPDTVPATKPPRRDPSVWSDEDTEDPLRQNPSTLWSDEDTTEDGASSDPSACPRSKSSSSSTPTLKGSNSPPDAKKPLAAWSSTEDEDPDSHGWAATAQDNEHDKFYTCPSSPEPIELYVWTDESDDDEKESKETLPSPGVEPTAEPTPTTNPEVEADADEDSWGLDPRIIDAEFDTYDESGGLDLVKMFTGAPLREGQFCQFPLQPGTKFCWKGKNCRRPHKNPDLEHDPRVVDEDGVPKSADTFVASRFYDGLPHQRRCPPGILFLGRVVHVVDPGEFYVIPVKEFSCLCEADRDAMETSGIPRHLTKPYTGYNSYMKMLDRMNSSIKEPNSTNYFPLSEVVAYNAASVASPKWVRAVVTRPTSYAPNPFANPDYHAASVGVTLLDTGEKVDTNAKRLNNLPEEFYHYAPFVYKCKLDGIIGINPGFWCSKAKEHLKAMVLEKEVLVEVKRTVYEEVDRGRAVHRGLPYGVSLRVAAPADQQDQNEDVDEVDEEGNPIPIKYLCVEEELCKAFRAVPINPIQRQFFFELMFGQQDATADSNQTNVVQFAD